MKLSATEGAVYSSPWDNRGLKWPGHLVIGCRACLGLTDMSRQRHKCLDWATAALGEQFYSPARGAMYKRCSWRTIERAHRVTMTSFGRLFRVMGIPMPEAE